MIKGTPDSAADDDIVGMGLIVLNSNAVAVGGVSVPGLINNPEASWLWVQYVPLNAGSAGLLGDDIGSVARIELDTKAQRKLGINEVLALVGESDALEYASITVNGGIRALAMHS